MAGPMPSFVPGKRSRTASAMTWAAEWRIGSSGSPAPASSSSSAEPRSGASKSSAASSADVLGRSAVDLSASRRSSVGPPRIDKPLVHRQDERSDPPAVPPAFASLRLPGAARALWPRYRADPGPVRRPLTGGASSSVAAGLPAYGPALSWLRLDVACPDRRVFVSCGGRHWTRTSDLLHVKQVL